MKIMGLTDTSFYLSWIIRYLCTYFITSILIALISIATVFPNSNFILIFIWYFMFCISLIFQSLFITTFFSQAKIGNIVAMVFYLAMYIMSFVVDTTSSAGEKRGYAFFSQIAVNFGADTFLMSELKSEGINFSNIDEDVERFSIGTALLMIFINILVFGILAFYFDQVFPNEFGKKKHPLFCFPCLTKNKVSDEQ